jgi:hypothetical protein
MPIFNANSSFMASIRHALRKKVSEQIEPGSDLETAIADAELLVAFAAKSTRGIKAEKVKSLFKAASAVRTRLVASRA